MRRFIIRMAIVCLGLAIGLSGISLIGRTETKPASYGVATCNEITSKVAIEILENGGNAFDAAIAAGFASTVVEISSTGIGGGGFATIYNADKDKVEFVDFREVAPLAGTRDMYASDESMRKQESLIGALAAGVPGFVAGMEVMHSKYATMTWGELLEPAVKLAGEGFVIYPSLNRKMIKARKIFGRFPETEAAFLLKGQVPKVGSILKQPDLYNTMKLIKSRGAKSFYRGEIANKLAACMKKHNGIISLEDLTLYKPDIRTPIRFTYRGGYEIYSAPPPSSGGIVMAEIMNILEPLEINRLKHGSSTDVHIVAESMKHAFRDRANYMGDPKFVSIPTEKLISKKYAALLRGEIRLDKASVAPEISHDFPGKVERMETSHISIIDAYGNAVSMTTTINGPFGSGLVVGGAGFLLNNEMDDFSKKPGEPNLYGLVGFEANAIAPGKKPLSSMSPTIVFRNGQLSGALGAPGGPMIISSVFQTLFNLVERGFEPDKAVQSGRIHHQWLPDKIKVEPGFINAGTAKALEDKGHILDYQESRTIGNVQLVWIGKDGKLSAVSDNRWEGKAVVEKTDNN